MTEYKRTNDTKQMAIHALERLPDDAPAEQVAEMLEFVGGIIRGIADADAGRVISHEELVRRIESCVNES